MKVRGVRIELGEIEAALASHPAVREAAVLAREVSPGDRRLVACVVPKGTDATPGILRAHLKERLPEPMVPSAWLLLERMPLTPNGKVDRRALARLEPSEAMERHGYVSPRTPAEETVASLFADLLGVEQVGAHDDFFALGGHSLLASRLAARLREKFAVPLPLRQLFESPTPAGLAGILEAIEAAEAGAGSPPPLRPVSPGEERLLSFAQQRLWFLDRIDPGTAAYNVPLAVQLTGTLNIAVLEATLGEIERRHEVLRTTFPAVDGRATQEVHPPSKRPLPRIDLSILPEELREAESRRLAAIESVRPFDLAGGPLWRALLVVQSRGGAVFLLTFHHIVADGWSMGVLLRELGALYPAIAAGRPSPLPDLPIQYADFSAWQRRWLQGDILEAQLDYWRRQLAGDLAPLDLPADRPRPPVQTWRGASVPFALGRDETEGLRALAQRTGATLFMTLLAAFQILLHRLTGREDVTAGSPVAGLGSAEAEPLIGLFTNMLVLRTDLSGRPSFAEALRRVREVTLGALFHQELPFERLVEELKPERDLSRPPLFQVMFSLQNTPRSSLDLPGLSLRPLEVGSGAARYDLTLDLVEGTEEIGGRFEYNTDLFDPPTVQRWALQLRTLIAGILATPEQSVADLPLETEAERHRRLLEWNDTAATQTQAATIHRLVEEQVARTPDVEAIIAGSTRLTYRELLDRSRALAAHLRSLGIGPESRVGISLHRSADLVVALLGVLEAGGAYVPLDPTWPAERLAWLVEDAGLAAVVVDPRTAGRFPGIPETLAQGSHPGLPNVALRAQENGGRSAQGSRARRAELGSPGCKPGAIGGPGGERSTAAYLLYTSGSTGRPKGVAVTHRNVLSFFAGMDAALCPEGRRESPGTSPGTWLAVTSVSFDISVLELLWTLTRGFTVVVHPDRPAATPTLPIQPVSQAAAREIDFSLFYFAAAENGSGDLYRLLLEGAKIADARGFTAVWTPERHFHAFGGLYPNPSVTGAAIAAVTERVQIRAGSVVLPLHNPIRVAEEWSLVDNLSHGRVGISFASGWHTNDFVLAPGSYEDRRDTMLRGIDIVRRLWRGESVRVPDGAGNPVDVSILPRPVQPELPVWVTAAGSPETFQAAGEAGANLLTHLLGQSLEELAEKIAVYREARRLCDGGPGTVSLMLHTFVGESLDEVRETVRAPMKRYLRSSLGLIRDLARTLGNQGTDLEALGTEEMDALLEHAFERYFETAGLMGTPESCLRTVARLAEIGVDEVACLIDFGVDTGRVLASLELLDEVRRRSRPEPTARQEDPAEEVEEAVTIAEQIRRHGVTHLQCTPTLAGMLAADPESLAALGSLHTLLLGGEALPPALLERLPRLPGGVSNMYGPTETTVWSATWMGEAPGTVGGAAPLGRPIANTVIQAVDRELRPMPAGSLGELVIGGAGVARGYLDRPELTAERFVPDPFSEIPGARLYRTGDLGRHLADGTLEFRGRLDQQVKVRGVRIEPGEVEEALRLHPAVADCAVAVRRAAGEDRLIAWLVPRDSAVPSVGDLRAFLLDRLPEPMVPSAFVPLERLPLTPNGKLDRRALPAPEAGRLATGAAWVPPRNEIERKIAAVWQEVLNAERVGVQDNFFELGGTSLAVAQVHSRLRAVLGRDLSMVDLFRHPTVGALARHLAAGEGGEEPSASIDQRIQTRREARERRRWRPAARA